MKSYENDSSISSHALSPEALLQVFVGLQGYPAPPSTVLAIRGQAFELGEALSAAASAPLDAALTWASDWLVHTA